MHRLLSSLVILACASISNAAHVAGTEWATVTGKLESEYPSGGPGAYAIVAEGDEILYSQGFGLADVEQNVSWSADSVVRIASLTKQFTAVAVLQLIDAHKLLIGDRLERLLPNCPNAWRAITIRELLNQTSGLTGDFSPLGKIAMTDVMPDQLLDLYRNRPLDSPPGTKWQYSNLNYWILGKVIEIVSAQSYADYVLSHVLAKGMSRTRYGSHSAIIPGRVRGYESDSQSAVVNARYFSQTLGYSAGGFLSTPDDMARWYAALGQGRILPLDTTRLAVTEARTSDGKLDHYGLGWYISTVDGTVVAWHGGSTFGFQSAIYWAPSRHIFVGVFKNISDERGEPEADARALLDQALQSQK